MQHVGVQQNQRAEAKRQADLRKQILHHCILRSEAGTCQHLARFGGLPRAQQIEPRHGLAHKSDRGPTVRAAAVRERRLAQRFLAVDDLFETPLEGAVWPKRLPHRKEHHQSRQRSEHDDDVVEPHPRRQPIGDVKILGVPHISNRAILVMMPTPVPSIANARPSRRKPRISL